jgi:hypothetical protein
MVESRDQFEECDEMWEGAVGRFQSLRDVRNQPAIDVHFTVRKVREEMRDRECVQEV